MKRSCLFIVLFSLLAAVFAVHWLLYSPYPSKSIQKAWEKNFSPAILPGYSDFRGHWLNADTAAYIFSYRIPETVDEGAAFDALKQRLPGFTPVERQSGELVLHRSVTYSSERGYDEYRFRYSEGPRRIWVLFANLDSDSELRGAARLVQTFHEYAR